MMDTIVDFLQEWGVSQSKARTSRKIVEWAGILTTVVILLIALKALVSDYVSRYGPWVVISGSTDGIGLAMARELARRGHSIVVMGRNEEKLAHTKLTLEAEPNVGQVMTVCSDLSKASPADYERIKNEIAPDNRDIGILINNAGVGPNEIDVYENHDIDHMHKAVNITIISTLYLAKMIVPGMTKRGRGLIVNVSSYFGILKQAPFLGVYGPIKHFVGSFGRQLLFENRQLSRPIDVVNLCAGPLPTKLLREHCTDEFFQVSTESYVKSAINAFSTRTESMVGSAWQAFWLNMYLPFDYTGILESFYTFMVRMTCDKNIGLNNNEYFRKTNRSK